MYNKTILLKDTTIGAEDKTRDFYTLFLNSLRESNLHEEVQVVRAADIGVYNHGLVIKILPGGVLYQNVKESDIQRIIDSTIKKGKALEDLLLKKEPVFGMFSEIESK